MSVENLGPIGGAARRANLKRLVQIAEHLLEANLVVQIQFCRAKCLALETKRRQPLKNIQRGDRRPVGKVEDGMDRGEQDLPRSVGPVPVSLVRAISGTPVAVISSTVCIATSAPGTGAIGAPSEPGKWPRSGIT